MKRLLLLPLTATAALASGDFYEDPAPAISEFLRYDRLPKKTLLEIIREGKPARDQAVDFSREILALQAALNAGKAPGTLVDKVDALIAAERWQIARGSGLNALLHDLRELCAGAATAEEAADYVKWRLAHDQALGYAVQSGREIERNLYGEIPEPDEETAASFQKQIAAAPASTKPHYLYAQAAWMFRRGDDAGSQKVFEKVVADFPDHPRAEVARYMIGRCLSRQSRVSVDESYKNMEEIAAAARGAFEGYLKKYPQGRFAGDAMGWLGGLEMNAEKYAAALPYFVRMLDVPGHPELAVGATKEIETCFRALHDQPADLAAALTDPKVALAAVYFANNEIEPVDGNGEFESAEYVAAWRRKLFPAIAKVLAERKELFKEAAWTPRYQAMLALAASGSGDQAAAWKLIEAANPATSEEVALARAVILQRSARPKEAAEAYRFFAQKFPASAMTPAARVREVLSLVDDHRSGEAAVLLMALNEKKKAAAPGAAELPVEPEIEEHEYYGMSRDFPGVEPAAPNQVRQLLDAVLNFGPLSELTAGAGNEQAPEEYRSRLRQVIAVRHLARERFAEAQPFVPPAQWAATLAPLAQLTAAARAAKAPAEKAAAAMKLAEAWAAARGKLLTVPLDAEEWRESVFGYAHANANFRRLENAEALGLAGANALDLDNRDELRHAFNWWLEASDAQPRTPLAATAIWRALRAMPEIAGVSPYTLDRAALKKWPEISRKLYDRLEKEHPAAPETKRFAVWWTFAPAKMETGEPIQRPEFSRRPDGVYVEADDEKPGKVKARVARVLAEAGQPAVLRKEVATGRTWAKAALKSLPAQCVVNFYEDLDLFLRTPDLAPEVVRRYVELRYDTLVSAAIGYSIFEIRPGTENKEVPGTVRADEALLADIRAALADPKFAKAADFLAFLEMAVTANHWVSIPLKSGPGVKDKDGNAPTYWGRDYAALERMCRAWLEKYPKSPKREAALLLHCRALRYAMSPYVFYRRVAWPIAPRWEGAELPEEVERLKFDAKVWKAELDRYDREYPKGTYADDVLGYRADLAVRLKDWKRALQITLAQLSGKEHLQPGAQDRLSLIFSRLAQDEDRLEVLAAIREIGGARAALEVELKSTEGNSEHPLAGLREWLVEQAQQ